MLTPQTTLVEKDEEIAILRIQLLDDSVTLVQPAFSTNGSDHTQGQNSGFRYENVSTRALDDPTCVLTHSVAF
jgi:hypothetical protein